MINLEGEFLMVFRAKVHVTLKQGVLDPQGKAVRGGLLALGYQGLGEVRIGKVVEFTLEAGSHDEASFLVRQMSERLLANPVIEDFRYEVAPEQTAFKGEGVGECASA